MSNNSLEQGLEKFENMIKEAMAAASIPGLSVAMVKDDEIVMARGFGARNLEENLPATPYTLFGIGSCTKSFTALAILQLAEEGKLDLHAPVSDYIPVKIGLKENPITIHHLLSMSSGLPNLGVAELVIYKMTGVMENYYPMGSWDDFFHHINGAEAEIVCEPGKRMFYLNSGYTMLGEIVARLSGKPFDEFIRERILNSLSMHRSTFSRKEFQSEPDRMTPYLLKEEEGKAKAYPARQPFHPFVYAAGGLLSSVRELTNYLFFNINGGLWEGERLLSPASMEAFHKSHCPLQDRQGSYSSLAYGYGWGMAEDFLGYKMLSHGGSTGISSAILMFVPQLKVGLACACNVGSLPNTQLMAGLAVLMGRDPEKELKEVAYENKLNMLAGNYQTYKGINQVKVIKKGAVLFVEGERSSYPIIPEQDDLEEFRFYAITGPANKTSVEFYVDGEEVDLFIERNRYHKVKK